MAAGSAHVGADDSNVYALDAQIGRQRWQLETGGDTVSSPAVAGGAVYVGSDDSQVYALKALTGVQPWHFLTGDHMVSSPTVG